MCVLPGVASLVEARFDNICVSPVPGCITGSGEWSMLTMARLRVPHGTGDNGDDLLKLALICSAILVLLGQYLGVQLYGRVLILYVRGEPRMRFRKALNGNNGSFTNTDDHPQSEGRKIQSAHAVVHTAKTQLDLNSHARHNAEQAIKTNRDRSLDDLHRKYQAAVRDVELAYRVSKDQVRLKYDTIDRNILSARDRSLAQLGYAWTGATVAEVVGSVVPPPPGLDPLPDFTNLSVGRSPRESEIASSHGSITELDDVKLTRVDVRTMYILTCVVAAPLVEESLVQLLPTRYRPAAKRAFGLLEYVWKLSMTPDKHLMTVAVMALPAMAMHLGTASRTWYDRLLLHALFNYSAVGGDLRTYGYSTEEATHILGESVDPSAFQLSMVPAALFTVAFKDKNITIPKEWVRFLDAQQCKASQDAVDAGMDLSDTVWCDGSVVGVLKSGAREALRLPGGGGGLSADPLALTTPTSPSNSSQASKKKKKRKTRTVGAHNASGSSAPSGSSALSAIAGGGVSAGSNSMSAPSGLSASSAIAGGGAPAGSNSTPLGPDPQSSQVLSSASVSLTAPSAVAGSGQHSVGATTGPDLTVPVNQNASLDPQPDSPSGSVQPAVAGAPTGGQPAVAGHGALGGFGGGPGPQALQHHAAPLMARVSLRSYRIHLVGIRGWRVIRRKEYVLDPLDPNTAIWRALGYDSYTNVSFNEDHVERLLSKFWGCVMNKNTMNSIDYAASKMRDDDPTVDVRRLPVYVAQQLQYRAAEIVAYGQGTMVNSQPPVSLLNDPAQGLPAPVSFDLKRSTDLKRLFSRMLGFIGPPINDREMLLPLAGSLLSVVGERLHATFEIIEQCLGPVLVTVDRFWTPLIIILVLGATGFSMTKWVYRSVANSNLARSILGGTASVALLCGNVCKRYLTDLSRSMVALSGRVLAALPTPADVSMKLTPWLRAVRGLSVIGLPPMNRTPRGDFDWPAMMNLWYRA